MRSYTQLTDYLKHSAEQFPDKLALVVNHIHYTYAEIEEKANRLCAAMLTLGVMRGDRVVIKLGNCAEAVIAFWATLKAGAVVSIISNDLKNDKIAYILKDTGAKVFITRNVELSFSHLMQVERLEHISFILTELDATPQKDTAALLKIYWLNELIKSVIPASTQCSVLSIDLASIIYTSGSTGEPKGIMMTHQNMLAASQSIHAYLQYQFNDIILSALPISFDYGLYQMIMATAIGATLILEKDFTWPSLFMKKISQMQATVIPGVPSMFALMMEQLQNFDFSSVRMVTNTGAALTPNHIRQVKHIFPNAKIFSMYGLSECKRCTYLPPEDIDRKPQSVGIAIPNTELWIEDEKGKRLGPHQIGQLVIRGATVMKGYWNKPELTQQKLKKGYLPGELVLHTGDYALLDTEGYLYFRGRMDEMIKTKGMKISPQEIELKICTMPSVKEVAVIGVDNELVGQEIYLFVTLMENSPITSHDIIQYCKKTFEKDMQPKSVLILKNLPKTNNGKIDKRSLHAKLLAKRFVA